MQERKEFPGNGFRFKETKLFVQGALIPAGSLREGIILDNSILVRYLGKDNGSYRIAVAQLKGRGFGNENIYNVKINRKYRFGFENQESGFLIRATREIVENNAKIRFMVTSPKRELIYAKQLGIKFPR